ncbi:3255_t:CDS:1, partial [Gigaspora margarita]
IRQYAKENIKNVKLINTELNVKIEQIAKENVEVKARVVNLEQKQLQK